MPNASTKSLLPSSKKAVDYHQGKAILSLSKKVSKLYKANRINSHFLDIAQTLTPGTTASIGVLTPISQGDGESNRNGDAVSLKFLRFSYTAIPNYTATNDTMRIIVFRWKSAVGGTAPTAGQVLEVGTNVDSPYNRDYRDSMVTLYDTKIDITKENGTKNRTLNIPLHGSHCTYTSSASTSWNEGHIFFLFLSTQAVNTPAMNYYSRVQFQP